MVAVSDDPFTTYHSLNLSARTSEGQLPSAHNRTRQYSDHFRTEDRYPNSHFYKERELVPPEKSAPSRFHRGRSFHRRTLTQPLHLRSARQLDSLRNRRQSC